MLAGGEEARIKEEEGEGGEKVKEGRLSGKVEEEEGKKAKGGEVEGKMCSIKETSME